MSSHSCTWNWMCLFIQFLLVYLPAFKQPSQLGETKCKRHFVFGMSFFWKLIPIWGCVQAGTSSTLKPIVMLPYGARTCNMGELIIVFSLVLKIILKWEWLPHHLKELKQQNKVLELFPNQCSSHIPPEPAVNGPGREGEEFPFSARFSSPEIRIKEAPGVALTGNWVLAWGLKDPGEPLCLFLCIFPEIITRQFLFPISCDHAQEEILSSALPGQGLPPLFGLFERSAIAFIRWEKFLCYQPPSSDKSENFTNRAARDLPGFQQQPRWWHRWVPWTLRGTGQVLSQLLFNCQKINFKETLLQLLAKRAWFKVQAKSRQS